LAMRNVQDLLAGGKHGAALTPGHGSGSLLVQYLKGERTPRMPMGGVLPEAAVAALVSAIDDMQPAAKPKNEYAAWLFHAPKAPPPPSVSQSGWLRNPIDAFILARLEEKGLAPAPPASPRALIRRVYFDLIGLPPPPEEVSAFEADPSPAAY